MPTEQQLRQSGQIALLQEAVVRLYRLLPDGQGAFRQLWSDYESALRRTGCEEGQPFFMGALSAGVFISEQLKAEDQFSFHRP